MVPVQGLERVWRRSYTLNTTVTTEGFPKFLVIRRDNIGDLVCTLPLIAALRHHYPKPSSLLL